MKDEEIEKWAKIVCFTDWNYEYSDDYSVWARGRSRVDSIRKEVSKENWSDIDIEDIIMGIRKIADGQCREDEKERVTSFWIDRLLRLRALNGKEI